jgi:hypothetical protein
MPNLTLRDAFDDRLNNFQLSYEWEAAGAALGLLPQAAEIVAAVYGEDAGARITQAIIDIAGSEMVEDLDHWRDVIGTIPPTDTNSPFLEDLHDLTAFAHFGILPGWGAPANTTASALPALAAWVDIPAAINRICDSITRLLELVPDGSRRASKLAALRDMALARLAYDAGERLTVHQLAALSDVSVKRVQNAGYADKKAPMVDADNKVTREGCERWLVDRNYHGSLWPQVQALGKLDDDWGRNVILETVEDNPSYDDFLFVPVADDGSIFCPALKRDRAQHFGIGPKGAEEQVSDYDEALQRLSRMAVACWRRPNQNGNWGIVSGQSWKRIRRAELEALTR